MDKAVSIRETKISLTPEERELMLSFFKRLKAETDAMPPTDVDMMVWRLNGHFRDKDIKSLIPNGRIRFHFDPKRDARAEYHEQYVTIYINLAWFATRMYDAEADKLKLFSGNVIKRINYAKMVPAFAHEFVHYKQHQVGAKSRGSDSGNYIHSSQKPYFMQPFEQQAWAVEYLEFLRQSLPKMDAKTVLDRLKRLGVVDHTDLSDLKKTDYKAWKSIMKNIIVTALQDLKQQEPSKKL